jgi:hypothetical protein
MRYEPEYRSYSIEFAQQVIRVMLSAVHLPCDKW